MINFIIGFKHIIPSSFKYFSILFSNDQTLLILTLKWLSHMDIYIDSHINYRGRDF